MSRSSLVEASRRPPSVESILRSSDPATETPEQGSAGPLDLPRKPVRIPRTPLHVNIDLDLDEALQDCMKEGREKTQIVNQSLHFVLAPYVAAVRARRAALEGN